MCEQDGVTSRAFPVLAAASLFSAAKELYVASTLLRLRAAQFSGKLKAFSEWERHTEAMRRMEREIIKAENATAQTPPESGTKDNE